MKKSVRAWVGALAMLLSLSFILSGCRQTEEFDTSAFYVYCRKNATNDIYPVRAELNLSDQSNQNIISSIWAFMCTDMQETDYQSAVPANVEVKSMMLEDYNLAFNFTEAYRNIPTREELLFRAAVVKTFSQLQFVNTVEFYVEGQPMMLSDGTVVGPQSGSSYVDLLGRGLNSYEKREIVLYFASSDGSRLYSETVNLTYNTNFPIEQYIVSKLLQGPSASANAHKPIADNTKLLSISTKDGICHVDFNQAFLEGVPGISPEVTIYSIVNSLTEVSEITSVRISVNGSSNVLFKDQVDLSKNFVRNLDYIEKGE